MAARLAAAGWEVKGFDIDAERLSLAAKRGIAPASGLTDAIAGARFVFTSLPKETVLIELTGRTPPAKAAQTLAARRIAYLRAPISGSTNLAEAGTLTTFVSGPKASFELAQEARYAKLAINLMVAVTAGMLGETLALAGKGGIGWETMLDLIGESVVASPLIKYKLDPLRRRDFTPAATSALLLKDLDLMVEAARQAGLEVPLASHMQALYRGVMSSTLAHEDFFSIVKLSASQSSPVALR